MEKYIGMDVHATSCTAAVMNAQGKRLGSHVIATSGAALVDFLKMQAGTIHPCIEEGAQSAWPAEILSPHVERMVVTQVTESRGQKSDERDAFTLAERLRMGTLETSVYKDVDRFGNAARPFSPMCAVTRTFADDLRRMSSCAPAFLAAANLWLFVERVIARLLGPEQAEKIRAMTCFEALLRRPPQPIETAPSFDASTWR